GWSPYGAWDAAVEAIPRAYRSLECKEQLARDILNCVYDRVVFVCPRDRVQARCQLRKDGKMSGCYHLSLFTDGSFIASQRRGGYGIALFVGGREEPLATGCGKLLPCHSSYQAEVMAIVEGLLLLIQALEAGKCVRGRLVVATDSQSFV